MAQLYNLLPLAEGPFRGLDLTARAAYGLIYDRWCLSCYNAIGGAGDYLEPDPDGLGDLAFCYYPREDLAAVLGVSERTARRAFKALRDARVISTRKARYSGATRIYLRREGVQWLRPNEKPEAKYTDFAY